jgi:hypothetical protein
MDMELIRLLETRIGECRRVIEAARQDLAAYEATLVAEKKKLNAEVPARKRGPKPGRRQRRTHATVRHSPPQADTMQLQMPNGSGNKTDKLRRFIFQGAAQGVTREDAVKFVRENIADANVNFAWTTIFKLKKREEIEERDGKLYPKNLKL